MRYPTILIYSKWLLLRVRENVTSVPTSQVDQVVKLVGGWRGWVIPPLWVDVMITGIPPLWADVMLGRYSLY